jgi:hypothetical protein
MKCIDRIDYRNLLEVSAAGKTRGYHLKLVKKRFNGELRRNFFSQRIVNVLNGLPQHVVDAHSVNCFKNRLDKVNVHCCG